MKRFGEVLENVDLKKYNTYGIGGLAKYMIFPNNSDSLIQLINYLDNVNIKYYILGNGSNVILPDEDYDGVIIKIDNLNDIIINENECVVETGVIINSLVSKTLDAGFINLGFLMGIPGSVGASILGNAGAYGSEIFEYVKNVTILDEDKNIVTLNKNDINYGYRYTEFKNRNILVLKATLSLEKGNVEEARIKIKENLNKRINSQPLEYKNAGSVFRNPEGLSAGKLIEDAGLKGKVIGGAMVSLKHANFIVNFNNAKSSDIIALINLIKKEVLEKFGVELVLEQIIVDW